MRKIILNRLQNQGPITFADFMETVLYHPQEGYYYSAREKIGVQGDYYTSPYLHPIFGNLLARQIRQMWQILDYPSPFYVVEIGAGKGLLCTHILHYCQKHFPELYQELNYLILEKSPFWQKEQKKLLAEFFKAGKVHQTSLDALIGEANPIMGCIFSNELIDSFPVHLICQEEGELQEIFVDYDGQNFVEVRGKLSTPLLIDYMQNYASPLTEGQRAEVNLKALNWLVEVAFILKRGFLITIDYGYEAEELYHPTRREGTLLCYYRHTTSTNPYIRLGYQDITAHVNFSALIKKGESLGLLKNGLIEQYKFLVALGLLRDLENLEINRYQFSTVEFLKQKLAMKSFLVPGGMGTIFKVLIQSKGVEEVSLLGLQDVFAPPSALKKTLAPDILP
ncbi:MAG: class I SAM-dependent methyltransferase [Thermodesulfobacteriota bacterium]